MRALDAYVKLIRAANAVSTRVHHHLRDHDLTFSQFGVLEALHHLGSLAQRDLCHKLLQTGGNITLVVDHLEERGLVRRERPPTNRRLVVVHLQPKGQRLIRKVFPLHARIVADDFSILTAGEQHSLAILLRKIGLGRED